MKSSKAYTRDSINAAEQTWQIDLKPYRVLLVIGNQWDDPKSLVVNCKWNVPFDYNVGPGCEGEFQQITALLKSWCVPFDILRLDQQYMKIDHFLDDDKKPKYGCIIWSADQSVLEDQDYTILKQVVNDFGISLIAISNRIKEPIIQEILGIKNTGFYNHSSLMEFKKDHFLTRGLGSESIPMGKVQLFQKRVQVELIDADVVAVQGKFPQITVKDISENTKAVWLGGDYRTQYDSFPRMRKLLRRAITWCIGYSIYKSYPKTVIMVMDDMGSSFIAYKESWHFPTLSKSEIIERMIKPLQKHNALTVLNVCPGFVDIDSRQVMPSWTKKFVDPFGTLQDYISTKEGIDEGLRLGVFEIQSHGWTHMQPDLDSPPGPWWDADIEGEKTEAGWYREFGDVRRGKDIPAQIQRLHMKKSIEGIQSQFNVTPLAIRPGGGGISLTYENDTYILAALEGFGWCGGSKGGYCGKDLVFKNMMGMMGTKENPRKGADDAPMMIDAPPDGHDKGVALNEQGFVLGLEKVRDFKVMGCNEYIGYMHAKINVSGGSEFRIDFDYDGHYCQYFRDNSSTWIFHLSDRLRKKLVLPSQLQVMIDGEEIREGILSKNQSKKQGKTRSLKDRIKALFASVFRKGSASTGSKASSRPTLADLYSDEIIEIQLPPGIGKHTVTYKPKK